MNKNFLIRILLMLFCLLTFINVYPQSGKVPPFRMMQSNGQVFMAQFIPFGKPILIIYFSPDCEECQKLTSSMLSRIDEFRNVSIVMITYQPVKAMTEYVIKNKLLEYENIYAGTEYPGLFVRNYYNVMHFPFMALYTREGNLVKKYTDKEINLNDLVIRIKSLK